MRTSVIETIHPGLTVRLRALDRPNIVRFAIIIPSKNLNNIKLVSTGNDGFPTLCVQVLVREEDPLHP